jgi:hypothetical protein
MGVVNNQTLSDFYTEVQNRGLARDFQLKVTQFIVNGIDALNSGNNNDLVLIKTATLPGKTVNAIVTTFMGLDFQIPGNVTFENNKAWNVKFYCAQDYTLRALFETSTLNTFDQTTSLGNMEPRDLAQNVIQLSLLDDNLNEIRVYKLLGAFITKIEEEDYDMTGTGAPAEVSATIAYQYWTVEEGTN